MKNNGSKRYDEGWKRIFILSVSYSVNFNNRRPMLTVFSNNFPNEGGSVLKCVHLQDIIFIMLVDMGMRTT